MAAISPKRRLVLASTSPYRRALLERLGVPFEALAPSCDERAFVGLAPLELARTLALDKARSIGTPGALVIGSDQVVDLDGEVLGKPGTVAGAVEQLRRLSGRSHRLVTAVAVHEPDSGRAEVDVDIHTLTMRHLERPAIERYVAHDRPLGCAGAYAIEARGVALFERVEADPDTADDTAIVGLPLMKTLRLLRAFGYDVLDR